MTSVIKMLTPKKITAIHFDTNDEQRAAHSSDYFRHQLEIACRENASLAKENKILKELVNGYANQLKAQQIFIDAVRGKVK